MNLEIILQEAKSYVHNWFVERVPVEYSYHTFEHTEKVVFQTIELSKTELLSDDRIFILALASWFHDSGFGIGKEHHEQNSCIVYRQFADSFPELFGSISEVEQLICATEYSRNPQNFEEMILRDADLHYLGTPEYKLESNALRLEWATTLGKEYTEREWLQINVDFLIGHKFYTASASHKFEATKKSNLEEIQKLLSLS
jgi:predicted metal-dependent HD superfamily phosphohydrolase